MTPTVAILLCTYNGASYLRAQIDSFLAQEYPHWKLVVSDDGSSDATLDIIGEYQQQLGADRVRIVRGPSKGFAANFFSVAALQDIAADYYAFSDQDDLWEADKLSRAVAWLNSVPAATPALYGTRSRLVDSDGREIGFSPLFTKPPSFGNALVQCIAGGNTMVFNEAARQLLVAAGADVKVIGHDWLLYQLVSGCGGRVMYDAAPTLRYRQHRQNLMGSNISFLSRVLRVRMLFKGTFRAWNTMNIAALERVEGRLTPKAAQQLQHFRRARNRWLLPRIVGLLRAGIYRQTLGGNLGLVVASVTRML